MLTGVFDAYYHEMGHAVVFDTHQSWTGKMALIRKRYSDSRVVC
jgi:hypothetical protein